MFLFSVMESPFCFANVDFVTIPATSFIDDLGNEVVNCYEKIRRCTVISLLFGKL